MCMSHQACPEKSGLSAAVCWWVRRRRPWRVLAVSADPRLQDVERGAELWLVEPVDDLAATWLLVRVEQLCRTWRKVGDNPDAVVPVTGSWMRGKFHRGRVSKQRSGQAQRPDHCAGCAGGLWSVICEVIKGAVRATKMLRSVCCNERPSGVRRGLRRVETDEHRWWPSDVKPMNTAGAWRRLFLRLFFGD